MIQETRQVYKPFEYQWAYDYYRLQQQGHWTKDEIKLSEDIQNWNKNLTDTEKEVIGGILKGFTQMEILVGDYWRKVAEWFPKPEIGMMSSAFSYTEAIHMDSYSMINEELGLDDFKSFLYDEDTKAKIDYFIDVSSNDIKDRAKSIAIFSAFAEGCMLFSSFAVLLSFATKDMMKGLADVVKFSSKDENLHSEGGCKLFRVICEENEGLRNELKLDITEAANLVYDLECKFIDNLFKNKTIRTLKPIQLKEFIKNRINLKLKELGYDDLFIVNKELLNQMQWFDFLVAGSEFGDFFATRVTEYSQTSFSANDMF
jgi:ribonucleoside-diphosphate reductase beta chain